MKSLLSALLVAAVAIGVGLPEAASAATPQKGAYAKKTRATGYWYRGKFYYYARTPRTARTARSAWAARTAQAAGSKKWQLPEYAPKYSASGQYIPTQYIYQKTNGEFRILAPTPAPSAAVPARGAADLRRALQNINGANAPRPPAPPAPPAAGGTQGGGTQGAGGTTSGRSGL